MSTRGTNTSLASLGPAGSWRSHWPGACHSQAERSRLQAIQAGQNASLSGTQLPLLLLGSADSRQAYMPVVIIFNAELVTLLAKGCREQASGVWPCCVHQCHKSVVAGMCSQQQLFWEHVIRET